MLSRAKALKIEDGFRTVTLYTVPTTLHIASFPRYFSSDTMGAPGDLAALTLLLFIFPLAGMAELIYSLVLLFRSNSRACAIRALMCGTGAGAALTLFLATLDRSTHNDYYWLGAWVSLVFLSGFCFGATVYGAAHASRRYGV